MKKGWQWPVLVTLALGFTVGVNVVMLFASKSDPNGTVVEPDYYKKAVDWDRTMARQAASNALGWSATSTMGDVNSGAREVRVALRDSADAPLRDAEVSVTLIHNREASEPVLATLRANGDGTYAGNALAARSGQWEVRITARRGTERFEVTQRAEAP